MEDLEPINFPVHLAQEKIRRANSGEVATKSPVLRPTAANKPAPQVISFDRRELSVILGLYGRKVAEGEWRDYAIDFTPNRAVFSIFRRTSEVPLYRIEKDPKLARKQGQYSVVAATGLVMRRGTELARVISVLDKKLKIVR